MIQNKKKLQILNSNSNDAIVRDVVYEIDQNFFNKYRNEIPTGKHLCICSGGTTSGCAKDNYITLDLRKNFNKINFILKDNTIKIGGGVLMGDLINKLDKSNRTFPIGLSTLPGIGYILTGGISPLSRRYGLAIDNVISAKGFLGNGEYFSLNLNEISDDKEINIWEGIKGAAPFFSIITEIGLKTFKCSPIIVFEGFVNCDELSELIKEAEEFPENMSLQWIFSDKIYAYIVSEIKTSQDHKLVEKYKTYLNKYSSLKIKNYKNFNHIKFFPQELDLFELNTNYHSEVISLLGKDLKKNSKDFLEELIKINSTKPNRSCYVAAQQLGCKSNHENIFPSYFVHRECSWKPWIYASWEKNNYKDRQLALNWMNKSWENLKVFFPYIHLAQLHNHLPSHKKEINLAFGNKLKNLKLLKNFYDPSSILPPL